MDITFGSRGISGGHDSSNLGNYFMGLCDRVGICGPTLKESKVSSYVNRWITFTWSISATNNYIRQHGGQWNDLRKSWTPTRGSKLGVECTREPTHVRPAGCCMWHIIWFDHLGVSHMLLTLQLSLSWGISPKLQQLKQRRRFGSTIRICLTTESLGSHSM